MSAKKQRTGLAEGVHTADGTYSLVTSTRPLNKRSSLPCTVLGFGAAHLGELFHTISDADALGTVASAWDNGCRYFDTAPWYGLGLSEHRTGMVLSKHWRQRDEFTVSTKVGRTLLPVADCGGGKWSPEPWSGGMPFKVQWDFTREGFERQHGDSLQRLGCGRVECLVIHDLDQEFGFHSESASTTSAAAGQQGPREHMEALGAADGGMRWLEDMRERGVIKAFGAGVNSPEGRPADKVKASNLEYVKRLIAMAKDASKPLDFLLLAGNHTLLDHSAWESGLLDLCMAHDIGVVMGGPYNSGILATGAVEGAKFDYDTASGDVLERVRSIEKVCSKYNIPLAAAALQFPLAHPAVASVIPGAMCAEHVVRSAATMNVDIPGALWEELKAQGLLPKGIPTPGM